MTDYLKRILQPLGLVRLPASASVPSYTSSDYTLASDEKKTEAHLNYLYKLVDDENNRLSLLESKTSQLISQTGIIFSLLSLFVPLLVDKIADINLTIKIILLLFLFLAFATYMLTIRNALKNFKVTDFNYSVPSPKNVINFQDKEISQFHNEVIHDLLYGLNVNYKINDTKATNLLHSYNSFKLANSITGLLVGFFCIFVLFFKAKDSTMLIKGKIEVDNVDSTLLKISNSVTESNRLNKMIFEKLNSKSKSTIDTSNLKIEK